MGQPLRAPTGEVAWVDDDHLQDALSNGYKPIGSADMNAALTSPEDTESGVGGAVKAGLSSFASGATLGASDVALKGILTKGGLQSVRQAREDHPYVSTATQIAGLIAPTILSGGEAAPLADLTPSGFVSNIGSKIAGLGEGVAGRAASTAAAGAFEGAAQNAGSYVSDVALGDRDLSAEGFLGAMGKGALYGGVAGGALSVASNGLIAARKLFPASEATPEAIAAAENGARGAIRDSVDTSSEVERVGKQQLEQSSRETQQLLADLESERAAAIKEVRPPESPPGDARQLLKEWRAKYPEGAVDYTEANAAARRGRLAEWAKDFQPTNDADAAIKAYFDSPQDPVGMPRNLTDVPKAVQKVANESAAKAAHDAYIEAVPAAANVSESGAELMARSMYASKRAAARALDDVYAAYKAGAPIADIQAAAARKMTDQLHELAEARADMIKSLAGKPDDLIAQLTATKAGLDQGKSLGEMILQGAQKPIDPDEAVARALGRSKDVNADIADIAPKITRYEAAKAQLTEAVGAKAPPDAVAHAQAFRQAQQEAQGATARTTAQATESIDKAVVGVPTAALPGGQSLFRGLASKASNFGAAYELLRSMGIPLPDPKGIPVIGPLLSLYLKAKIVGKVAGRFGGSFAATAEGTIAAKAAQTQNRINTAIDAMASGAAKVLPKAADFGGPAALAHKLFDTGEKAPYTSTPKLAPIEDMYEARLAELTAAQKPGAIEQAIRARIATSDPSIVDAIIKAEQQKLSYLYGVAPKPDTPPLPGQPKRSVSKAEILGFGNVLAAYHDPAAVFERVAAGGVSRPAEVDCIENCYPRLMAQAQKSYVEKLADAKERPPYAQRIAISTLIGIPADSTMMPDHAAYLAAGHQSQPPPPMPHSLLASSVNLGQQTLTRLDR